MNFPPPSKRQAELLWFSLSALAVGVLLVLLCFAVWGIGQVLHVLSPVVWPLAIAGVLAYLLDPIVDALERHKVPRPRAILCVFAMALAVLLGIGGSVVPQVVVETRQLVSRVPEYANRLRATIERWATHPPMKLQHLLGWKESATNAVPETSADLTLGTNDASGIASSTNAPAVNVWDSSASFWSQALGQGRLESATNWLAKAVANLGNWLFGTVTRVASWFGVLAGLALVPVYTFYFLLEKKGIRSRWTDYLPGGDSAFKNELVFVIQSINDYLITFFRGQVLVALCDGILYTIGFLVVGVPYAVLLGVIATALTMIPFLGAIFTCVTALVLALVQYGDWQHPLLVLVVFAIVQSLEGLVIQPKILGDRVGLHPLTIIIAVMVGTTLLGGLLGGILAIPCAAALRVLLWRYVWERRSTS